MKQIQKWRKERRFVRLLRRLTALLAVGISLGAVAGCGRAPSFNILGSFFPAWLICMVAGIVLTAIANWVLVRCKLELPWAILVYPCLAAFFAFTLWLVIFS